MNKIKRFILDIALNNKTLKRNGDQIFLNLTEIKSIKKRALRTSQKVLSNASAKDFINTDRIDVLNKDVRIKQDNLLDYLKYYEDFKASCNTNTKEKGRKTNFLLI